MFEYNTIQFLCGVVVEPVKSPLNTSMVRTLGKSFTHCCLAPSLYILSYGRACKSERGQYIKCNCKCIALCYCTVYDTCLSVCCLTTTVWLQRPLASPSSFIQAWDW